MKWNTCVQWGARHWNNMRTPAIVERAGSELFITYKMVGHNILFGYWKKCQSCNDRLENLRIYYPRIGRLLVDKEAFNKYLEGADVTPCDSFAEQSVPRIVVFFSLNVLFIAWIGTQNSYFYKNITKGGCIFSSGHKSLLISLN